MKIRILAACLLVLTASAVFVNTYFLGREIDRFSDRVSHISIPDTVTDTILTSARVVYADFKKAETYMSLSVNHNDLTNIEEIFSEMIGYLSVGDANGAKVAKSRLTDALGHLKRLSGINIDSIV